MANKWYTTSKPEDNQGLIVEEETGKNIAVSYDVKDAKLIASAPDAVELLEEILTTLGDMTTDEFAVGGDRNIRNKIERFLYDVSH